jgi:RNA polymerase sigma-70 factor (ECF subfamily)
VSAHDDTAQLVRLSRAGEPRALATLYRRFAPDLLGYLERVLGQRAEAEDVLHETFLRIFEGRGRYDERGQFRSWLFRVATRLALDRVQRAQRQAELLAEAAHAPASYGSSDPSDGISHRELELEIDAALSDLPPAYMVAFHLRVREELSYREIASMCGDSEGTLRSRVHHALKRVRLAIAGAGYRAPGDRQRQRNKR